MPFLPFGPVPALKPGFEVAVGPVFGQDVLGSEDTRRGATYGVRFVKTEPRLKFRGTDGALVLGTYYMFTKGGGFEDIPVNKMHTFGATVAARYPLPWEKSGRLFADFGFGLCYNSIQTRDLDSKINSTPFLGVGWKLEQGSVIVQAFHMSNAGLVGNNQGLNQLQLIFAYQF